MGVGRPDSAVGIVTKARIERLRVSRFPVREKRVFCTPKPPDKLWGINRLLFSGYGVNRVHLVSWMRSDGVLPLLRLCLTVQQFVHRPGQDLRAPGGSGLTEFLENRYMKVSALSTARLYPPRDTFSIHFCKWLIWPQVYNSAGRIMSLTPSGIEPVTSGLLVQCFNQLRHAVTPERLRYTEL